MTSNTTLPLTPPQAPLRWDHTVQEIADQADAVIAQLKRAMDKVASLAPEERTFASVFAFLEREQNTFNSTAEQLAFYQNVSASPELRVAACTGDGHVYEVKQACTAAIEENGEGEKLGEEEKRLVQKMILDGKRAGLRLPTDNQDEMKALKKELEEVCQKYMKNCNEENVFAADMYATNFKDDPLDPVRVKLHCEKILRPGSSRDELDLLNDFLGRPPNNNAFSRQLFGAGL